MTAAKDHPPPKRKGRLGRRRSRIESMSAHFTHETEKRKWRRDLEWALDAVLEAESGDLGLIERNLVESATQMLAVASEIRGELRR